MGLYPCSTHRSRSLSFTSPASFPPRPALFPLPPSSQSPFRSTYTTESSLQIVYLARKRTISLFSSSFDPFVLTFVQNPLFFLRFLRLSRCTFRSFRQLLPLRLHCCHFRL